MCLRTLNISWLWRKVVDILNEALSKRHASYTPQEAEVPGSVCPSVRSRGTADRHRTCCLGQVTEVSYIRGGTVVGAWDQALLCGIVRSPVQADMMLIDGPKQARITFNIWLYPNNVVTSYINAHAACTISACTLRGFDQNHYSLLNYSVIINTQKTYGNGCLDFWETPGGCDADDRAADLCQHSDHCSGHEGDKSDAVRVFILDQSPACETSETKSMLTWAMSRVAAFSIFLCTD